MSIVAPEGRILVREALPALGQLAAFLFVVGCIYVIDAFVRALFGTVEGAIGWIPFAGKVAKRSVQKIEQKITHSLGTAEQAFDKRIGASFHKLAHIVRSLPGELLDQAKLLFGVAVLLAYLPTKALVRLLIRAATHPLRAAVAILNGLAHLRDIRLRVLRALVDHLVLPLVHAIAARIGHVIEWDLPRLRARERALEKDFAKLRDWVKAHKTSLTTGAFLGAFAWALSKFGLGYLRCSRSKAVQKELCSPKADFLLSLLEGGLLIVGTLSIVELAKELQDEMDLAVRGVTGLIREKTG